MTGSHAMITEIKLASRGRVVNQKLKLTKRGTADKEGTRFMTPRLWSREDLPRMLVKEPLEVECRKFYVLYANIEAHGHM